MGYYSYPKEERVCHFSVSEAEPLKYRRSFACALKKSASGIADQKLVKPTRLTKVIANSQYRGFWGEVEMRLSGHSVARTNVFLDHPECERIAQ